MYDRSCQAYDVHELYLMFHHACMAKVPNGHTYHSFARAVRGVAEWNAAPSPYQILSLAASEGLSGGLNVFGARQTNHFP